MDIGERPTQLDGCWKNWNEVPVDVMIRTEMESGALHTRRRFTSRAKIVDASVTLGADLYLIFMDWFNTIQQQGAIATRVITPYGTEEVFQFVAPPTISWSGANDKSFTATVKLYQGAWF